MTPTTPDAVRRLHAAGDRSIHSIEIEESRARIVAHVRAKTDGETPYRSPAWGMEWNGDAFEHDLAVVTEAFLVPAKKS